MHSFAERFWVVQAREASMAMADRCYQPDGGFNGDHAPNGLGRSGGCSQGIQSDLLRCTFCQLPGAGSTRTGMGCPGRDLLSEELYTGKADLCQGQSGSLCRGMHRGKAVGARVALGPG